MPTAGVRRSIAAALLALLGLALADGRPAAPAHHTNVVQYVFQRVGEGKAGPFEVVLAATRPKVAAPDGKKLTPAEEQKLLGDVTHRFQAEVRPGPAAPQGPIQVRLRFTQEEWSRTFTLPREPGAEPIHAANVALGPRGKYEVQAIVEAGAPARRWEASLSFDYDYEKLKDVMRALLRDLDRLGRETLTLGLDGEAVPPAKEAQIRKLAKRFQELAPGAAELREGAAQEAYEAEAKKLIAAAAEAGAAAARADYAALAARLAAVRAACESCHAIFQQADAQGKDPKLPPRPAEGGGGPALAVCPAGAAGVFL